MGCFWLFWKMGMHAQWVTVFKTQHPMSSLRQALSFISPVTPAMLVPSYTSVELN